METRYFYAIIALQIIQAGFILKSMFSKKHNLLLDLNQKIETIYELLKRLEYNLKDDLKRNREEISHSSKENRTELNLGLKDLKSELSITLKNTTDSISNALNSVNSTLQSNIENLIAKVDLNNRENRDELNSNIKALIKENKSDSKDMKENIEKVLLKFQESFDKNVNSFNKLQNEKFNQMEIKQDFLIKNTEQKLDTIKLTVEEKLDKTLADRLGQSFETVGKQLIEVQKGLGEMQVIAQDVGGLKRALTTVKSTGLIGEVQLSQLLDQILAPEQYEANVKTKSGSNGIVEFAIKLPGKSGDNKPVWIPLDAKFPSVAYSQLQEAYETNEPQKIDAAKKVLESRVLGFARDINEKYIDPPNTTDFGIMFIPFEGIYAEIIRSTTLMNDLHSKYKIIVTGPTTLAAILNSLQLGFKTLAIEKRSSEVWEVLGAVKTEFEKFGGILQSAQKKLQSGIDEIDNLVGTRTNAINRKLRNVESLSAQVATNLLELDDFDKASGSES